MKKEEIFIIESMESLCDSFKVLSSSEEYEFYLDYLKDIGTLYLDNDDTFFIFDDDYNDDPEYLIQFNNYLGNSEGLLQLLKAIGIKFEEV